MKRLMLLVALVWMMAAGARAQVTITPAQIVQWSQQLNTPSNPPTGTYLTYINASGQFTCLNPSGGSCLSSGGGGVTSVTGTTPISSSGGNTPAISCPTCAIGPGVSTATHAAVFAGTDGLTLADGGVENTGTVTSVATTSPITGGTFTTSGTIACATCTTNAAALTSNAVVLGGGGQAAVAATGISGASSELDVGINTSANGVIGFNGSTSGKATITAPAVAGTSTNALAFSNVISLPVGATSTVSLQLGSPNNGWYSQSTNQPTLSAQNTAVFTCSNSACFSPVGQMIGFAAAINNSQDVAFSRLLAGTAQLGNGTLHDETGLLRWGGSCKPTSAATMNVSGTAVAFCTWTLPSSAKTWSWMCSGTYTTTTATDTFSIGMNAAQAPTSETGNAIIYSTLTGTSTAGSATSTSSGAVNILTGSSVSNVTNEPFSTSGTIQASATGGTFTLTGTLTGTSPSGTVNVGTTCLLY